MITSATDRIEALRIARDVLSDVHASTTDEEVEFWVDYALNAVRNAIALSCRCGGVLCEVCGDPRDTSCYA